MNDPAASNEQPSYLDRCREMDFGELLRFVEDSLEGLSDPDFDANGPRSDEEFWSLWERLCEKGGVAKIPLVPPLYEPSEKLKAKRGKLERLREHLVKAPGNPSMRKRDIQQMQRREPELAREVAELLASEKRDHANHLDAYRRQTSAYTRPRIVERVRRKIERAFKPEAAVPTNPVYWRLLPPGELSEDRVRGYYAGLQRSGPGTRYDPDRIVKALSLGPDQRYEEIGGVEGYTVFTFPHTSSVLLECPIIGNAIYVIHKDWERWSKMTKQELMADESGDIVRIVHRPSWFEKVKQELGK